MNNQMLLVFISAHLCGDFLLQTNKIARLKAESIKGLFIHSLIVTVCQVLFLSFFGINGIIAAIICGVIHFFIDYIKYAYIKKLKYQLPYFIIDQIFHFIVISGLSYVFMSNISVSILVERIATVLIIINIIIYISTVFT